MTGRTRALVARADRKQHFATLGPGEAAWITVCEVPDVPVFGAEVVGRDSWATWLEAAEHDDGGMCLRCRTALLVAGRAVAEVESTRAARIVALEEQVRDLTAEVQQWTSAALAEARGHADFLQTHHSFRRAGVAS